MAQPAPDTPAFEGDLLKSSAEYRAHEEEIQAVLRDVRGEFQPLIKRAIEQSNCRSGGYEQGHKSSTMVENKLPPLAAIERQDRINCFGAQLLHHAIGMEVFRREHDGKLSADLRPLLTRVASVRRSIANFEINGHQPHDYRGLIGDTDAVFKSLVPESEQVPSLVPYLFTSSSTLSTLRKKLGDEKFSHPDLLLGVGDLFRADTHALHAMCMNCLTNGAPDMVEYLLKKHAEALYPPLRQFALFQLLKQEPDLFAVHVIALVEGERCADAIKLCEDVRFRPVLERHNELAQKYVAALRHTGQFDRARSFCDNNRDNPHYDPKKFAMQYKMAVVGCTDILPMSLPTFQARYPDAFF